MTELKCLSGDEPRIIATQEFIDKHKFKLRTQEEILEKYNEYEEEGRMFDFRPEVLLEHLSYENGSKFLSDEYKAKVSSGEVKHTSVDNVLEATQDFLDYMNFAWRKAQDERGLSASRSIAKLSAWLWLLNREDLESKIQEDGLYNPYGAPALVEVCKALEINVPESLIEFSKHKC